MDEHGYIGEQQQSFFKIKYIIPYDRSHTDIMRFYYTDESSTKKKYLKYKKKYLKLKNMIKKF